MSLRRLAVAFLLSVCPASAQILGTTAGRDEGAAFSMGLYLDTFDFLDMAGLSIRGELPLSRRMTPFLELGATRFETSLRGNIPDQSETSWMLATGTKVYGLGEQQLGMPISLSGYARLSFSNLKNIDLFCGQALALATYDFSDGIPLALTLGAGVSYRYTDAEAAAAAKSTTNQTLGRYLIAAEWGLSPKLALEAEFSYEERGSGGLGLKYRR